MNLTVIGTGYVGVITASVFADFGNHVFGLDIDKKRIETLKKGKVPFYEPQVEEFLKRGLASGRLKFTTSYKESIPHSEIIFICVGTPQKESGEVNLDYVFEVSKQIASYIKSGTIVVIKSTVPPGTTDQIKKIIKKITKKNFSLASCPEFLREGQAIEDTLHPSRIVIGSDDSKTIQTLLNLHKPINGKIIICDVNSAQMIKYAANAFLATKVSFANSIARLCDKVGADAKLVMDGIGYDPRIGRQFLYPGLGFGGSCFPKDTAALSYLAKSVGCPLKIIDVAKEVNQEQIDYILKKINSLCRGAKGKTIGILGLSFKPNTDDIREARSVILIEKLQKQGAKIKAYDPVAIKNAQKIIKNATFTKNPYQTAKDAHILVIVTEWNEFKDLDLKKIKKLMKTPIIVDGRNIYEPQMIKKLGFTYEGIGRR
jgi:UDPglucose 6-dehydrogenase